MAGAGGVIAAGLALLAWVGLLAFRGGFWRADQRLAQAPPERPDWPGVVAVIPARNEAATIADAAGSLLAQDYPGRVHVVVVDDNSDDGTAKRAGTSARLTVIPGHPLAPGWTGKLWAVKQGLETAAAVDPDAPYVLLTDADIVHDPLSLRRLVAKAESESLDLVSVMARLRCESPWERLLIPAFVFFFQKLYPFPWVNGPGRATAAAAGGCMLVRRRALSAVGGIDVIRDRLIDDCALAAVLKAGGPVWLGLTTEVRSLRAYETLAQVWHMVARTAYAQLGNSVLMLVLTVLAMTVTYLVPPLAAAGLFGGGPAVLLGLCVWPGLMTAAMAPTLRLYQRSPLWALALPVAALLYTLMTVSSAARSWRGRGGAWKGRHYGRPEAADG